MTTGIPFDALPEGARAVRCGILHARPAKAQSWAALSPDLSGHAFLPVLLKDGVIYVFGDATRYSPDEFEFHSGIGISPVREPL